MLAGVVLHATLSFLPGFGAAGWPIADRSPSVPLAVTFYVVHIFRMTLFFTMAGFFARLLLHRNGTRGFIRNRAIRIALPFVAGWIVVMPPIVAAFLWASRAAPPVTMPLPPPPPLAFPLTHLWFLYVLLLLYAATLGMRAIVLRWLDKSGGSVRAIDSAIDALSRLWLLPIALALPVLTGFLATAGWIRWFGIPTPDQALIPQLAAALAFTTAFAFGWFLHRQTRLLQTIECRWVTHAIVSIAVTIACILIVGPSPDFSVNSTRGGILYAALYALASWTWTFAIIGIALRFFSTESARMRYVSDASYWIYIMHLPLVFLLQAALITLPWHWSIKFTLILVLALPVLFGSYHVMVRRTVIGKVLNGRRRDSL